ncbi:MAG TPA: DUF4397 domain-containing protein [Thermomicrobiales bacterium]|nr:DUF4397 domain-containing protein [Thermomicrobiales bacterium]
MSTRPVPRRILSFPAFLVLALMTTFMGSVAAAQEASPAPSGMADCTTALGIGGEGDACVSIVHASPDAPLVEIYVDGELVLSGLGFGWWSEWVALPAGDHQVQVTASGSAPDTAVIDATLTLEAGMAYQVAATGFLEDITPQVFPADVTELADDTARVRVVHTVPDAPAVDIAVTGGDVLVGNLEFPTASEYLEVPAGNYDLEVRVAGTEDVVLPLPGVELEGGTVYDVYAIGTAADGEIFPFVIPSSIAGTSMAADDSMTACAVVLGIGAESDSCVNILHASPDAPAVDIWVNGDVALSGVEFGAFSGWLALPAGEYRVQVTPAGQGADTAVIDATLTLDEGMAYHVAATGTLSMINAQVYAADLAQTDQGNARVRVIHASPDAPAVDIAVTGGDVLIPGLEFPNGSDYLETPAGTYDLEVRAAGTMDVALALPGVTLEAGTVYEIIAVGQLSDGTLDVLVIPTTITLGS